MIRITKIEGTEPGELRDLIKGFVTRTGIYQAKVMLQGSSILITKIKRNGKWCPLDQRQEFANLLKEHWQNYWFKVTAKVVIE